MRKICLIYIICVLYIIIPEAPLYGYSSLKETKQEGEYFGRENLPIDSINSKPIEEFLPEGESLPNAADLRSRTTVKNRPIEEEFSEIFVQAPDKISESEGFFKNSQEITKDPETYIQNKIDDRYEKVIRKCTISLTPYIETLQRRLHVEVDQRPALKKQRRICLGHSEEHKHHSKETINKEKDRIRNELSKDPTIKDFEFHIKWRGGRHRHILTVKKTHKDDVDLCRNYRSEEVVLESESIQEIDLWEVAPSQLEKVKQCRLAETICLEPGLTKTIQGKEVKRQCWLEQLNFHCFLNERSSCSFLNEEDCQLVQKQCLRESAKGCLEWEHTYQCLTRKDRKITTSEAEIFGRDDDLWGEDPVPNTQFSQAVTKIQIFEEMKQQLESSLASDPTTFQFFKGDGKKCSIGVVKDITYDCCLKFGGLSKELQLSQCNTEEIALAEMRESGQCRFIGSHSKKLAGMKTRTENVFCCFPTKLARVLHEQAREQLGIGWGSSKNPQCRGLSIEEISRVDFNKLDLNEAFDGVDQRKLEEKIPRVEEKLKMKIESGENNV